MPIRTLNERAAGPMADLSAPVRGNAVPLPLHRDDFARLRRPLAYPGHFALVVAVCGVADHRDALILRTALARPG